MTCSKHPSAGYTACAECVGVLIVERDRANDDLARSIRVIEYLLAAVGELRTMLAAMKEA